MNQLALAAAKVSGAGERKRFPPRSAHLQHRGLAGTDLFACTALVAAVTASKAKHKWLFSHPCGSPRDVTARSDDAGVSRERRALSVQRHRGDRCYRKLKNRSLDQRGKKRRQNLLLFPGGMLTKSPCNLLALHAGCTRLGINSK